LDQEGIYLNTEIIITLLILLTTVVLFLGEFLRVDLIALLVLGSLVVTGILDPIDALSGFSNPAVITVWAMFIISGAIYRTGIANKIGQYVLNLAGSGEKRLLFTIMLTAGILSAFMNNVGVAALMLPVVMDISRKTKFPPSKLLMPLAIGCLLGGMTTLIGTPPNILSSDALASYGLGAFNFFDFTPTGTIILIAGILFTVFLGLRLLPSRDVSKELRDTGIDSLEHVYEISQDLHILNIPAKSVLSGKTLAESRFGTMLNISVIGIIRNKTTQLAPSADTLIQSGDQLIVSGAIDQLSELYGRQHLVIESEDLSLDHLISEDIKINEITLSADSKLIGKNLIESDFRKKYGVVVLAIQRGGNPVRTNLDTIPLQAGDVFLIQGEKEKLHNLQNYSDFTIVGDGSADAYRLHERLIVVRVPDNSALVDKQLSESRLAEAFGLTVVGIVRNGNTMLMPLPEEIIHKDDLLFVKGREENIKLLQGLQDLRIDQDSPPQITELESEGVGIIEAALSPHTTLGGKNLRQIHFREKYGLSVLGIYRAGEIFRSNLSEIPLRLGDALLLFGRREKITVLGSEPDFLVLTEGVQEAPRTKKAVIVSLILVGVVVAVLFDLLPIAIAAVIGAALMVISGALTMDEAYRFIDWRSVFLIAGLIPLGIAMETTGAASFIANNVLSRIGEFGSVAVMAGLFILTSLGSQVMPNAVVTVLMAPIAINVATNLNISPFTLMMTVAIAASAAFMSPVAHPANILVMGPGGYRTIDYIKVGLPLTILILLMVLFVLPVFWPL